MIEKLAEVSVAVAVPSKVFVGLPMIETVSGSGFIVNTAPLVFAVPTAFVKTARY